MPKGHESKRIKVTGVKVMPDFSSTCLWELSSGGMIYPRDIGLSCNIVNALDEYIRYYDNVATGRPGYCVIKKYEKKLYDMGRKIADAIKAEKPDIKVEHWYEVAGGKIKKEDIKQARSSVGTEHSAYTRKVGSSSLPVPTKNKRKKS